MNNVHANSILSVAETEINDAKNIIQSLGQTSSVVPYLNRYCIIRACGALEQSFKTIIADYCNHRSKIQVKKYINKNIRDSSSNPSFENICRILKIFDQQWHSQFKASIRSHPQKDLILLSLESLVEARNDFAHGGSPSTTVSDVIGYFNESKKIIIILDSTINT